MPRERVDVEDILEIFLLSFHPEVELVASAEAAKQEDEKPSVQLDGS